MTETGNKLLLRDWRWQQSNRADQGGRGKGRERGRERAEEWVKRERAEEGEKGVLCFCLRTRV